LQNPKIPVSLAEIKKILLLAFPLILSNLTQPLLTIVDTILSGHQNEPAVLGGVAMGGVFFNTIFWSFGFLRMATTGLVAQAYGARQEVELAAHVARAVCLGLALGILVVLLQKPLIHLALGLLGGSSEVQAQAMFYCQIRIWAAPASLVNYAVLGTLLGRQRARSALLLQASIQVVNIVVALWLVSVEHWGIAGIATGTLIAEWCGCALGIVMAANCIYWRQIPWRALCHMKALQRLFRINRDILLRTLSLVAAYGWFTRKGALAGDAVLAANAVLLNVQAIASYGLDGFANVTEALVGESIGAGDRKRFNTVLRASTVCALASAVLFSLFFAVLGTHMIDWFTNQPAVVLAAKKYLIWVIVLPLVAVWGFQLDGVFIGATRAGDLRNAMVISFTGFLLFSWLFVPRWGNDGLWLAFCGFMALRGLTLGLRLKVTAHDFMLHQLNESKS